MANETGLLQCYNRGCGQKYDPSKNTEDMCRHHPGEPFFHDAYKGWSCCNKKCTDFTEFLNIKGCTTSKHCNEKPPEPIKPVKQEIPDTEVIEVKPLIPSVKERPPFSTPMQTMTPEIAASLKQSNFTAVIENTSNENKSSEIALGTLCKNGGCNTAYDGSSTNNSCVYHPGCPIFHEGMKYWSCCRKRTTDFSTFLNQVGCGKGEHVWIKEEPDPAVVQCRWDWHQTGTHVVVSVYAKRYCPQSSVIKLNPIRLYTNLVFPEQSNATFLLDVELAGIVDVDVCHVSMFATKVEIKLKKAEPGHWTKLNIPKVVRDEPKKKEEPKVENLIAPIDAVDLSDL